MSIPSRFLSEVPPQLIENLGGSAPGWAGAGYGISGYGAGRRQSSNGEFGDRHYNYEDESQEIPRSLPGRGLERPATNRNSNGKPFVASWMKPPSQPISGVGRSVEGGAPSAGAGPGGAQPDSIDNIARFFGGRPGSMPRPAMEVPPPSGASGLKSGQRVRHAKYGEGTVLVREGDGEDAKLTVMFARHGLKKLIERFANLEKI
jgi:DNA helicase-2/ATP-dependent DNA helicase PcrA